MNEPCSARMRGHLPKYDAPKAEKPENLTASVIVDRSRPGAEQTGSFAARSPERPNPIAVSVCEIKKIDYEKGVVSLTYFDAFTCTPVPDIKPYTPGTGKVDNPSVPDRCAHRPKALRPPEIFPGKRNSTFNTFFCFG